MFVFDNGNHPAPVPQRDVGGKLGRGIFLAKWRVQIDPESFATGRVDATTLAGRAWKCTFLHLSGARRNIAGYAPLCDVVANCEILLPTRRSLSRSHQHSQCRGTSIFRRAHKHKRKRRAIFFSHLHDLFHDVGAVRP